MSFLAWLDARDSETLAEAWSALDAKRVEVGAPGWSISMHGAAQLAASFLGWSIERLAWLGLPVEEMPAPTFSVERTTARCFLEYDVDVHQVCYEYWDIRETSDGERGIQLVSVACRMDDGTREGSGASGKVVRVFDRATRTGASIFVGSGTVATIGEIDLAALALFDRYQSFALPSWKHHDPDGVRGLVAQLAVEIDAHFDVSTTWPAITISTRETGDPSAPNLVLRTQRFESGPYAVELSEQRFRPEGAIEDGRGTATLHGLPWGYLLAMTIEDGARGTFGNLRLRMPVALGETVLARLARVPGVDLQ